MAVGDEFLAPRHSFVLVDILVHNVGREVGDLEGFCTSDGGIMPLDGLANGLDGRFER